MGNILKKFSFSFLANIFSAVTSVLMILVLPKVMTMEDYGTWQLFMFYFSYVGFFHFGWIDGIYLRYGGQYYEKLNKAIFGSQFCLLAILFLSESILVNIFLSTSIIHNSVLEFIIRLASIAAVFVNILTFANFTFQLSDKIKEYARNIVLEKFITLLLIAACVCFNKIRYDEIIYITLISNFVVMCFALYSMRDLIFVARDSLHNAIVEAWENISAGSKLMLSNIAGMLILGIIRFGISQGWDIITFGKVSLTLSISNFLMVFISAVSVVLFPILKRINQDRLAEIYVLLRRVLSYSLLALLVTYYPLKMLLGYWLPKYSDSLFYMGMLLPVCIFESKMQMLVNTYLKSLRQELLMLKINVLSVAFALITTYVAVVIMHNLKLTLLAIVVNFAFRLFLAEHFIEKLLAIKIRLEVCEEILVVICFILINLHGAKYSAVIYLAVYGIYAFLNRKHIRDMWQILKLECAK